MIFVAIVMIVNHGLVLIWQNLTWKQWKHKFQGKLKLVRPNTIVVAF